MKLQLQDIVRTKPFGTLAVVERVNHRGDVALVLPANSKQRVAWYEPSELDFVSSLKDLVGEV
jgi:hypothetical protein